MIGATVTMRLSLLFVVIVISMMLTSCGPGTIKSRTASEVDDYIAQTSNIPDFDRQCLYDNEYKFGMQAETLRFMLGEPKEVRHVTQPWGDQEIWYYKKGGDKHFTIENGGVTGIERE